MADTLPEAPGFPPAIPSPPTLDELHAVMKRCTRCDLSLSRIQVVPGAGNPTAGIFFVGEAPGQSEDRKGIPFVGASGQLLNEMLQVAGVAREEVFIGNVVRCRPPENRNPKAGEIRACAGWLSEQIRLIQPALVVTLGRYALDHFIAKAKITQLQGSLQEIEYRGRPLRIFPLFHPAAVLRVPERRPEYEDLFRRLGVAFRGGTAPTRGAAPQPTAGPSSDQAELG